MDMITPRRSTGYPLVDLVSAQNDGVRWASEDTYSRNKARWVAASKVGEHKARKEDERLNKSNPKWKYVIGAVVVYFVFGDMLGIRR